jgi:peroxiredoxin
MRLPRSSFILLIVCTLTFALASPPASAIEQGQTAPEIELADFQGRQVKLSELRGKVIIVDFWASWCGPCRDSFPVFERLNKTYRDRGLVVLGVNVDNDPAAAQKFLKDTPVSFTVLADSSKKVAKAYAPPTMPSSYLVDRTGKVRSVHAGFKASDAAKLEAEIKALLK